VPFDAVARLGLIWHEFTMQSEHIFWRRPNPTEWTAIGTVVNAAVSLTSSCSRSGLGKCRRENPLSHSAQGCRIERLNRAVEFLSPSHSPKPSSLSNQFFDNYPAEALTPSTEGPEAGGS
jgi:hypothetical protein